jgi:hypothetical protein
MMNEDTAETVENEIGYSEVKAEGDESHFRGWNQSDTSLSAMINASVSKLTKRPYVHFSYGKMNNV